MESKRQFTTSLAATVAAALLPMLPDGWHVITPLLALAAIFAVLTWGWWPDIRSKKVPPSLASLAGVVALVMLIWAAWYGGKTSGFSEAQQVAERSIGAATITLHDHRFALGDAAAVDSEGRWVKADAGEGGRLASALVGDLHGTEVSFVRSGFIAIRHRIGAPGETIFLSQEIPGGLTTEPPKSGISQPLGVVVTTNLLLVDVGEPWDLDADLFKTGKMRPDRE